MSLWNFPKTSRTAIEEELTLDGIRDKFDKPIIHQDPFRNIQVTDSKRDYTGYATKVFIVLGLITTFGVIAHFVGKRK